MRKPKFEFWKGKSGWFWHFKAGNGQILCHSESYTTRRNCVHGIVSIRLAIRGDRADTVYLKDPPKGGR